MMTKSNTIKTVRCAIYTRVSTSEGLEQDFNSLDNQQEAAKAYITSQKSLGWICLPDQYNDGGFTGANLERPALKRLLADIKNGNVDVVLVYKIDRLSRSLIDFTQLIEIFDQHNVSFVSVTQQFATNTPMGRLMLNILLSFAQYERELTAERTRDKVRAARRRGKWTGGNLILGYDVAPEGGRLIINEHEAEMVRAIFDLYLEYRSLIFTAQELNAKGWKTKQWVTKKGRVRPGKPFNKTNLYNLITNVLYIGKVKLKSQVYDGEHPAIVDDETWKKVQALLKKNGNGQNVIRKNQVALLKGILFCRSCGTAMIHTYTTKNGNKRYRYYVCTSAQKQGWNSCSTKSVPAPDIEDFVIQKIHAIGQDPDLISEGLKQANEHIKNRIELLERENRICKEALKKDGLEMNRFIENTSIIDRTEAYVNQLADFQEKIRNSENKLYELQNDIELLKRSIISKDEFETALLKFGPIWDSLSLPEQARLIQLIFERVEYDGNNQILSLTFRSSGIQSLLKDADNH